MCPSRVHVGTAMVMSHGVELVALHSIYVMYVIGLTAVLMAWEPYLSLAYMRLCAQVW